jgi:hypothetical protein
MLSNGMIIMLFFGTLSVVASIKVPPAPRVNFQ